ncbi:hypothetical protein L1987_88417 [Smallanthus sonchifolius]|nr:hypothetical protein L1987_88417 [Smallanthus sonchifolius]
MNRGEPPDDLSKIRGEILNSDDPFTLPRTDTCTECSYGKVDSWVWNLGVLQKKGPADRAGRGGDTSYQVRERPGPHYGVFDPKVCVCGWKQRGEGDGWRSLADQFGQLSLTDQLYYRKKKEVDRNEIRLAAIFDSDLILGEEVDWEAKADPSTTKCGEASPHQAASIAKCSATKQALPNTTDAEVGKPEVPKEVGGRK